MRSSTRRTPPPASTSDVVRQVVVLVGAAVAVAGAFVGSGALGGPDQQEVGDGALAADATPVAPAGPAFAIWTVIYAGLVLYAVWQALPAQRADSRQRRVGWLVLASMVLNALWITVVQAGLLTWSVPVIVVLLMTLATALRRLLAQPPGSTVERVVLDGTMGLYLGWVTLATVANVTAVLAASGVRDLVLGPDAWAVVVLALAGAIGVAMAVRTRRPAIGAALVWGLAWVVVARTAGDLLSPPAAVAAGAAAVAVAVVSVWAWVREPRAMARR